LAKSLAIIGAGAKAAAIVARAAVLRDILGPERVPDVIVIESRKIGAAWDGSGGFASGYQTLCTPGEKDVGYPYDDVAAILGDTRAIGPELFARFSWPSWQAQTPSQYAEWVERGRDHPTHGDWAEYLKWVFAQAKQTPVHGIVPPGGIRHRFGKWEVRCVNKGKAKSFQVDGVVLTGSGKARTITQHPGIPADRVLDAESFWARRNSLKPRKGRGIAVAGSGGGAGAIIAWLAERYRETQTPIYGICRAGTLFPRGDGYSERRWFVDVEGWTRLTEADRLRIIDRTEAGVVSGRLKDVIDHSNNVHYVVGEAKTVRWRTNSPGARDDFPFLEIDCEYDDEIDAWGDADYLINATGFDSWSLLDLVEFPAIRSLLGASREDRRKVELAFGQRLSLPEKFSLARLGRAQEREQFSVPAGLHVPALSGLAQGPGMGNLGSLGLMAASVLQPYLG
jgi:mycobactin lysine-N-oxygenase